MMPDDTPRSLPLGERLAQHGVLSEAIQVFARKGFAATRVEDILEAAGIARRTFYRHFKGKEEILAALYEVSTGELLKAIGSGAEQDQPLAGILRGIDVYLDYHADNADALRVLRGEALRPDSQLAPMRRAFRQAVVGMLDAAARRQGKVLSRYVFVALLSALEGVSLDLLEARAKAADIAVAKRTLHALVTMAFEVPGPSFPRA
jgi:AcrR family transcriptional regulator